MISNMILQNIFFWEQLSPVMNETMNALKSLCNGLFCTCNRRFKEKCCLIGAVLERVFLYLCVYNIWIDWLIDRLICCGWNIGIEWLLRSWLFKLQHICSSLFQETYSVVLVSVYVCCYENLVMWWIWREIFKIKSALTVSCTSLSS